MTSPIKGYLYLAIGALLLLIAMPFVIKMILFFIAIFFILSGAALLKDNWS
ncbi:MAG: hypothetical protein K2X90_04230 [Candidatus Babeliaceae bacterium]|nr:hypothetical protein [Candidatus Babeliaceae bacterium]